MYRVLNWAVISLTFVLSVAPAAAQGSRPGRPYRGLFGSGAGDAGQQLTVSGSVSTGYSDNLRAEVPGRSGALFGDGNRAGRGALAQLSGNLAYSYQAERFSVSASAGTSGRYYPSASDRLVQGAYGARLSFSAPLRARTSLSVGASATYQPYSLLSMFPVATEEEFGDSPALDLDLAATEASYLAYSGTIGLSHRLSPRTSIQAGYAYGTADRVSGIGQVVQQSARAGLSHNIARGVSLHAGYRYGEVHYPESRGLPHHTIDAGVNYNRTLSISRRTSLSFGTGSAAVTTKEGLRFTVVGNASLNHEIGRSWSAQASYGRHVGFDEAWDEPVLTDSLGGGLGGMITRRLRVSVTARAARGNVGLIRGGPRPASYHAGASLHSALTRFMSVGLSYSYFHQQLGETALLPSGFFSRSADRQSVRAVANLWAPLFQRVRRANASR